MKKKLEKNWFEWCVFSVGSALLLATLCYLAYQVVTFADRPPLLEVRHGEAEQRGDVYAMPVTVTNRGDHPAEMVRVEVQLKDRDGGGERAELLIQLLPGGAARRGFVSFKTDPNLAQEISGRAVSFETK
jgi:uncharacterized protein (TIGR02588 family)